MNPILAKVVDKFGGGMLDAVIGGIKSYFPPSMTEQERATAELGLTKVLHEQRVELLGAMNEADAEFNGRIKAMEGTASDLKTIPYVGGFIIFLRGTQRPLWGFATMYFDYCWFAIDSSFGDKQELALIIVNILVLSFLFGERAFKNVAPLLERMLPLVFAKK